MTPEMAWVKLRVAASSSRGESVCRVEGDASLGPAKGQVEQGALPGHQRRQRPHLVEVGVGVIAQATLERAPGPVVLDPIATKREHRAVVGVDGHLHVDLPVGLGQQDPDVVFEVEQRRGPFDVGLTDS